MPRVPIQEAPRVEQRPMGTPYDRVNRDTGAAAIGAGVANLGGAALKVADVVHKEREKADNFRALEADLEYDRAITDKLWNKEKGFLLQEGHNALDPDPVYQDLEKERDRILGSLQGDNQRRLFMQRASQRDNQTRESVERHSGKQRIGLYQQVAEGQLQSAIDMAAQNYHDPAKVEEAIKMAETPLVSHLRDNLGAPSEKISQAVGKMRADIYGRVLDRYIGDAAEAGSAEERTALIEGAKRVFAERRDTLGEKAKDFQKRIAALSNGAEIEEHASKLIAGHTMDNGRLNEAAARDALKAIPDNDPLKKEKRATAEHLIDKEKARWNAVIDEHYQGALSVLERTGSLYGAAMAPYREWFEEAKNGAVDKWNALKRQERAEWRSRKTSSAEDRRAQAELNAFAVRSFQAIEDDKERVDLEVDQVFPDADRVTRKQIQGMQKTLRERVGKKGLVQESEFSKTVNAKAGELFGAKKDAEKRRDFIADMRDWRDQYLLEHEGKEPTREEFDKEIGKATTVFVKKRFILPDKRKFGSQLEPGDEGYTPAPAEEQKTDQAKRFVGEVPAPAPAKPAAAAIPAADRERLIGEYRKKYGARAMPSDGMLQRAYELEQKGAR